MRKNIKIYNLKYDFSHKEKYRKIELYTQKKNIQNINYNKCFKWCHVRPINLKKSQFIIIIKINSNYNILYLND